MEYIGVIEDDAKILSEKQVIIFGAGKVGKHCYEVFERKGCTDIVAGFCDNNNGIVGQQLFEKNIFNVDKAVKEYPDAYYLVASICVRQMVVKLKEYGIEKIHIIRESN